VWDRHWERLGLPWHPIPVGEGGWTQMQAWEVMSIFGAAIYNGCQAPFETAILIQEANDGR
jgi:hypothetical protein